VCSTLRDQNFLPQGTKFPQEPRFIPRNELMLKKLSPVENEEGYAEAPPDADKDQLLDGRRQKVIDHLQT
jgi:hypothetical protein